MAQAQPAFVGFRGARPPGLTPARATAQLTAGQQAGLAASAVSSTGDELGVVGGALVGVPGVLEQLPPGGDVRTAAEQGAAFALGHAAPHPELDAVVQCVREAFGADDTATADQLGPVLRRPL